MKVVRPRESTVATQPQLQPALLRSSAMISQYFTRREEPFSYRGIGVAETFSRFFFPAPAPAARSLTMIPRFRALFAVGDIIFPWLTAKCFRPASSKGSVNVQFVTASCATPGPPRLLERAHQENPPPEPFRHSTFGQH
jgi:hypothetical protein